MKLPIKNNEIKQEPEPTKPFQIDEIDAFGGASSMGQVYVKECRRGEIIKKEKTIPWRRGIVNKKIVFYYLKKGDSPPPMDDMIPSVWK
jgi:hypothetical protein